MDGAPMPSSIIHLLSLIVCSLLERDHHRYDACAGFQVAKGFACMIAPEASGLVGGFHRVAWG